jgi:hypothetical protein
MPAAPGEGLIHMPRGRDWPSIREAGVNAATLEASPGDTASRDGEGDAQEGNETVDRLTQRKRLIRWSQKGTGPWAGGFRHVRPAPHTGPGGVCPPYVHRHTRRGNGVPPCGLSGDGPSDGAGANRLAHGEGARQKPRPLGKPEDRQTDVRLSGMESFQVGCTRHERVGNGDGCMAPTPLAQAGGSGVQARTAALQSRARGR